MIIAIIKLILIIPFKLLNKPIFILKCLFAII